MKPEKKGMTEDQIVALLDQYAATSYGVEQSALANERALAIARYNTELYGNEVDGRSDLVSSELRDTVETVVPQLMRIFLGGDLICEFDPENEQDVAKAKQESKYVNWLITQKNASFQVFGTWFRDAMVCKNGYVKAYWEERSDVVLEQYRGVSDDALALLQSDPDIQITGLTSQPAPHSVMPGMQPPQPQAGSDGQPMPPQQPMLHDVDARRRKTSGYVRIANCPGEEILVHESTTGPDLRDCVYVEHRTNKTLSEIRQMGYDVPDDWAGVTTFATDSGQVEGVARDRFQEQYDTSPVTDASMRRATFREVWARIDEDGDGIAELRRICLVNKHVVNDEEADLIPIACITPVIQPHRHVGYGYYDFLKDIEAATTSMVRSFFDNIYLANNGRYGVNVDNVNVDDLLISRPGGVVRVKGDPGANIFPIIHPSMGDAAKSALMFLGEWKKNATGVMADAQSLSADVLNNSTATGISQAISIWQARVEGVARCFAETGMTDLFRIVHALTLKNATSEEKAQIGGQWVSVDPREWVKRTSLTVTVGLGTGSKEAKLAFLNQVAAAQAQGLQIGIATPANIYETAVEMTKEGGYKDYARFWTDPRTAPPQPPKDDPLVQAEKVKQQGHIQATNMKVQGDMAKTQQKSQADLAQTQMEAALAAQLEKYKAELKAETDRYKADLQAQTQQHLQAYQVHHQPRPQ